MYKISIEDIEKEKTKIYQMNFDDEISEINACVKANLKLASLGEFIEVTGHVDALAKLECDLCLKEFEQKLSFDIKEMYAKTSLFEEPGQETELKGGQFITDLNGEKEIDIYDLLYQSVILQLPNKKVCGINCKGQNFITDEDMNTQDERMAIFKTIKIQNSRKNSKKDRKV